MSEFYCAINAGGAEGSYLCLDQNCYSVDPTPYMLSAAPTPCKDVSVIYRKSSVTCLALDVIKQSDNSTEIDLQRAQAACSEGFSCREDENLYVVLQQPEKLIVYDGKQYAVLTTPLYALKAQLPKITSPSITDVCGANVAVFTDPKNGVPLAPSILGISHLSANLGWVNGGWLYFAQITSPFLGKATKSTYADATKLLFVAQGCKMVDSFSILYAETEALPTSLTNLVGKKLYGRLMSSPTSTVTEVATNTVLSDGNTFATYTGKVGPVTSCSSSLIRTVTVFSSKSCGEGTTLEVFSEAAFCNATLFYADLNKTALSLSGPGYLTAGGKSRSITSAGKPGDGCATCPTASSPSVDPGITSSSLSLGMLILILLLFVIVLASSVIAVVVYKKRTQTFT
jgi:hypothetical protein